MPASTSSKTSVGTASRSASTLRQASIVRDSSPPEAARASDSGAWPDPGESSSSIRSAPPGPGSSNATRSARTTELSIPSSCSSASIADASAGAAAARPAVTAPRPLGGGGRQRIHLGGEGLAPVVGTGEGCEPVGRAVEELEDLILCVAVLALEGGEGLDPLADLLEPGGVGLEGLAIRAHVVGELRGLGGERGRPVGERACTGIRVGRVAQGRRGGCRPVDEAVVAGQRGLGLARPRRSASRRGPGAPPRGGAPAAPPAPGRRPRSRGPGTRAGRARARGRARRPRARRAPPRARRRRSNASRYTASATTCASPAKRSQKAVCVAAERRRCAWCWPWTSTRSAPSAASVDAVAICPPMRAEPLPSAATVRARTTSPSSAHPATSGPRLRTGVEPRLHACRRRARPHQRGRRPAADREGEPDRHHGLAGAGLAGEDVEAGVELEVEVVDHPEAADVELPEHAAEPSGRRRHRGRPGSPNFSRTSVRNGGAPPRRTSRAGRVDARIADPGPQGQLEALAAVRRQEPGLVAHDLERDLLAGVQHERAVEDHVRRDRREDERVDARHDDRPAGRERVRRRPVGVATMTPSAEKVVT